MMSPSNRKVVIALLLAVSLFATGRVGWFYYDFSRAKKVRAVEEAERLRKAEAFVTGLLQRQDAPAPTRDGQFPCVSISVADSPASPQLGKCSAPGEGSGAVDRFEVDLRYGNFFVRQTDLSLNDVFDVPLTRTYNSGDYIHPNRSHPFGNNANHPFDICPLGTRNPYTYNMLVFADGEYLFFDRVSEGTSYADAVFQHTETSTRFYKAVTKWNGNGWTTFLTDGTKMDFPEAYNSTNMAQGALVAVRDAQGNKLELLRDGVRNLMEIRTPHGRSLKFQYDDRSRIIRAEDDRGQWARYQYNSGGMLTDVAFSSGRERHYTYDGHLMTTIEDEKHNMLVRNTYRYTTLVQQDFGNGQVFSYHYSAASGGPYADSVVITMPNREKTEVETASSVPEFLKHPRN
jgi:YD repeat-containing protein